MLNFRQASACILLLGFCLLFVNTCPVRAESVIRIYVDGRELACDVPPQAVNGRLLVPLRVLGEALGFEVNWDGLNQTAILEKEDMLISLTAGSTWASVNGSLTEIDTPMQIVNSRVLAPLRFISENFGCTAEWLGTTQEVRVYTEAAPVTSSTDWITYCNLNVQMTPYQVDYPASFFSDTSDPAEVAFTSPDGLAAMSIVEASSGHKNISECYAEELEQHENNIVYQHLKSDENWYVLAWKENGQIVYCKTYYCGDSIVMARFSYPEAQDKSYQSTVEHFLRSFLVNASQN